MITEDYVSFEVAKLLKEKGFECATLHYYYDKDGDLLFSAWGVDAGKNKFLAPTLQRAMKWLREVHNMHVDVDPSEGDWAPCVLELEDWSSISDGLPACNSYEEACEMGIKYALENLI